MITARLMRMIDEGPGLDWREKARCRGFDAQIFFPEENGEFSRAKEACGACTSKEECLAEAIRGGIAYGVWGGLTPLDRRNLRKELAVRGATAAATV